MGKSSRVADENMVGGGDGAQMPIFVDGVDRRRREWNGFSILYSIARAPFSFLSCISHPHVNGADGAWVSGGFSSISEMNHLMGKSTCPVGVAYLKGNKTCAGGVEIVNSLAVFLQKIALAMAISLTLIDAFLHSQRL